jgi:hypothetical protein
MGSNRSGAGGERDDPESLARLRAAGWSPVEESWTFPRRRWVYRVVVAKDGRGLAGEGRSVKGAWHRAADQALGVPRSGG